MRKHLLLLAVLGVAACSKKDDATPSPAPTPAPVYKQHTLSFIYINTGLDQVGYNLGAGINLSVDRQPIFLTSVVDSTYFISPQDPSSARTFQRTYTVQGAKARFELGFYNVVGTSANPLTLGGKPQKLGACRFVVTPVVDGVQQPNIQIQLGSYSQTTPVSYDNGKNPSRVYNLDLTKF